MATYGTTAGLGPYSSGISNGNTSYTAVLPSTTISGYVTPTTTWVPLNTPEHFLHPVSRANLKGLLWMRMRWPLPAKHGPYEIFEYTPPLPFLWIEAVVVRDAVSVIVVAKSTASDVQQIFLDDTLDMFPSDTLITQLRIIAGS